VIKTIKEWIRRVKEFPKLEIENSSLKEVLLAAEQVELLEKYENSPDVYDSEYWDNKWKQSTVWYNAPKRKKVTSYVKYKKSEHIKSIADSINGLHQDPDGIVLEILEWLESQFKSGKFKYKLDKGETWTQPSELLERGYGDCDDYGILEYNVIRQKFLDLGMWEIVKHRLKCVAGNVNRRGSIPSGAGGHFYLMWLAEDGEWYCVESTYYRKNAIVNWLKLPQKLNPMYGTIWFTFNESKSWSQNSLTVSKKDFKKNG
jgi:hypothetical protein|tara:strand:- start:6564 stop:7340 length:777 start_codon:yes stop_codon:yes gene_type:complete